MQKGADRASFRAAWSPDAEVRCSAAAASAQPLFPATEARVWRPRNGQEGDKNGASPRRRGSRMMNAFISRTTSLLATVMNCTLWRWMRQTVSFVGR